MGQMQEKLNEIMVLTKTLSKDDPTETNAFLGFLNKAESGKALDIREKELINVALAIAAQCEWCIAFHVEQAVLRVAQSGMKLSKPALWQSSCTVGPPICT